jgi:hypothetical protein
MAIWGANWSSAARKRIAARDSDYHGEATAFVQQFTAQLPDGWSTAPFDQPRLFVCAALRTPCVGHNGILSFLILSTTSEMSVCGMDGNWLAAVKRLIETRQIYVNQHHSSSRATLRPDGVIAVNGTLAAIVESKALESDVAAREIPSKLHAKAFKTFPLNQLSIPGFATCATCVSLHSVTYNPSTSGTNKGKPPR